MNTTLVKQACTGDVKNMVYHFAQSYESPIKALIELIKNQMDAGATEVYVWIDLKNARLIVFGDGSKELLDGAAFARIRTHIGDSSKSAKNHGLGLYAFPRIGDRLTVVGKCGNTYYLQDWDSAIDFYYPGVMMDDAMEKDFEPMIEHIENYRNGSIWQIDGIGETIFRKWDFRYDPKKELESRRLYAQLQQIIVASIHCKIHLKMNTGQWQQVVTEKKRGKLYKFDAPSKQVGFIEPIRFEYSTAGRTHTLELMAQCELYVGSSGVLLICQDSPLDVLDLRQQKGFRPGTHIGNSIYRDTQYQTRLAGLINIHITSVGNTLAPEQIPSFYTASREDLCWKMPFGDAVHQLLGKLGTYLRPILKEICDKKDDVKDKKYVDGWNDILDRVLRVFGKKFGFDQKGTGPTETKDLVCPECGHELIFVPNKSRNGRYECTNCPWWKDRLKRGSIVTAGGKGGGIAPIKGTTPRQQQRGTHGYRLHLEDLLDEREVSILRGTDLYINSKHPCFEGIKDRDAYFQNAIILELTAAQFGHWDLPSFLDKQKQLFAFFEKHPMRHIYEDESKATAAVSSAATLPSSAPASASTPLAVLAPKVTQKEMLQKLQSTMNSKHHIS